MNRLRMAVIGAGHLGRIHARLLGEIDEVDLIGVVDPVKQTRLQVAQDCGACAFASHRDLLGSIDAAVVATPTQFHHAVTSELLQSGIHCLVEKPITSTVDQADELIAAAAAKNLTLAVGHVERFNPALSAAVPHVVRPRYVEAVRTTPYTFRSTDVSVVLDLMIHDLDAVLSLVSSPVVDVHALGTTVFGPHEDLAKARLTFADGCIADLTASRVSFQPQRRMHVYSESGYAGIDFAARTAAVIHPGKKLTDRRIDFQSLPAVDQEAIKENLFSDADLLPITQISPGESNPLLEEQRDFVHAITTGRPPRVTGAAGRTALQTAHRVLRSIAVNHWDTAAPAAPQPRAA